jgi:hypothetical protein
MRLAASALSTNDRKKVIASIFDVCQTLKLIQEVHRRTLVGSEERRRVNRHWWSLVVATALYLALMLYAAVKLLMSFLCPHAEWLGRCVDLQRLRPEGGAKCGS